MATDMFSSIENKEVNVPKWPQHPYTELHQGVQLKTVPIRDIRNLIMTFPIPDTRLHYKSAVSILSSFSYYRIPINMKIALWKYLHHNIPI